MNKLLTDEEVRNTFPELPQRGLWFELADFSGRDYGNDWGFYGFKDGKNIFVSRTYGDLSDAGEAARRWKVMESME